MSNNNNDNAGMSVAFGLIVAAFAAMAVMVYFIAIFAAFVLTIISLFAWNSPVTIGRWTVRPHEARDFVKRGLAGAVLLPVFAIFLVLVFGSRINDDAFIHIIMGGYLLGSLGVEYLRAQEQNGAAPHQTIIPPSQQIAPPPRAPEPPAQPFRFASWNDEDGR
jgi:hypothetical protein